MKPGMEIGLLSHKQRRKHTKDSPIQKASLGQKAPLSRWQPEETPPQWFFCV